MSERALSRRMRPLSHVTFTLGLVITLCLLATAALSLVYTPQDPLEMSIGGRLQGPSAHHLLGTVHVRRGGIPTGASAVTHYKPRAEDAERYDYQ